MNRFDAASGVRAMPGESVSGDAVAIVSLEASLLVALVDGLGHGPAAAEAAGAAIATVRAHAALPLDALVATCDAALGGTRGAAMALVRLVPSGSGATLEHAAVGNVLALTRSRTPIHPIAQPGIVGRRVRRVVVTRHALGEGDLVVLVSDGIRADLALDALHAREPARMVDAILHDHATGRDDASCAIVRVLARSHA